MTKSTRTGGRTATEGVIPGRIALSVGLPRLREPSGFLWTPLTAVARLESGHTPSRGRPEYWGGEIPWIGIRDATANHGLTLHETNESVTQEGIDNSSARVLPVGTVCLSRTASVGFVVTMGRPMATSQDFVNWVCGPALNARYLSYVFQLEQESIRRFAHGTTHQTMYYPEAKALHALLPSRATQDAVADVLGALDDKIAANVRAERKTKELIHALYERAVRLDDQELPFFEVFSVEFGEAFGGTHFSERGTGRPLIRIRDLKTLAPQVWTIESRPREAVVLPGDTLVGMDAEFRATWWLGDKGLLNQRVCRVSSDRYGSAMVAMALREPLARIEAAKTGTTVIHLNKRDLELSTVRWPSEQRGQTMDALAQPLLNHLVQSASERSFLSNTRDELLPLLMSGKVRVKDAEKIVGDVT